MGFRVLEIDGGEPVEVARQILDPLRHQVDHRMIALAFPLDHARNPQQPPRDHRAAEALIDALPDHDIGRAGLVFQRDEDPPLRRARPLADDDQPGHAEPYPRRRVDQRRGRG